MAESAKWEAAIKRIRNSVVTIHFSRPRSFDGDPPDSGYGTGFVVDAKAGLILTNCHIVGNGPFTGYCVFYTSYEECEVKALYRDPIHDFGFLRFDPKSVRYTTLEQVNLRPDLAQVGCEVRILGGDGKKKGNSILSGHISDLDQSSAGYLNSWFIQSAMFTNGGSSGSPVFNVDGQVIALHSSAGTGATRYHVPLDGPVEALRCIQEDKPVPRGTIFTEFVLRTFDSCRRLGLSDTWERELRKHANDGNGLLIVHKILPESPLSLLVQASDILIKIDNEFVMNLKEFNRVLNGNVGKKIKILIQRNGSEVEIESEVYDLHEGTPDRFLEIAGAVLHELTYTRAHKRYRAARGVYLAQASVGFNVPDNSVLKTVDGEPTPTLEAFIEVMKKQPDIARLDVKFENHMNPDIIERTVVDCDQRWVRPMSLAVRNDRDGIWHYRTLHKAAPAKAPPPQSGEIRLMEDQPDVIVNNVFKSFVRINCQRVVPLDGFDPWTGNFFGLVVDADVGLVIASRAWIPYDLCSLRIQIADTIQVPGNVIFIHPLLNFAVIKYDASLVQADVKTAVLSDKMVKKGDASRFLGMTTQYEIVMKASILDIRPFRIISKFEGLEVEPASCHGFCDGALFDNDGVIQAFWLANLREAGLSGMGLPACQLFHTIADIRKGISPQPRILGVEVDAVDLVDAPPGMVPEQYLDEIKKTSKRQLIEVARLDCTAQPQDADQTLRHNDLILKIDGVLISRRRQVETTFEGEQLNLLVLRDGEVKQLIAPTLASSELLVTHVLQSFGVYMQQPPPDSRESLKSLPSYIYIIYKLFGSPADLHGLSAGRFIVTINERPVTTLMDVRREVSRIPDDTYFRIGTVGLDRTPRIVPIKKNEHYYPTTEYIRENGAWARYEVAEEVEPQHSDNPTADIAAAMPQVSSLEIAGEATGSAKPLAQATEVESVAVNAH